MSGSQVEMIEKRRVMPDLSGVDQSIRPLIQAMLKPLPADRPASMAAVAAWEPGAAVPAAPRAASGVAAAKRGAGARAGGGRVAAILGA